MIRAFKKFISENNLCDTNQKVLIAISGGPDSVAMLDLFKKAKYNVALAHCNFKLRGKESDQDEKFVKDLGKKYQAKTFTIAFETRTYAEKMKLSVQEAARSLRYNWFEELGWLEGFDRIALAHHQDDLIETFFINMLRGAGIKGLKSIPVRRDKFIRPLMFTGRKDILAYCKKNKLKWRNDSSNQDEKYLRNAIRSRLMPMIDDLKPPAARKSTLKSIMNIVEDYNVYQHLIGEMRTRLIKTGDVSVIEAEDVKTMDPALFYHLIDNFGFDRSVTDKALISLKAGATGKVFESSTHQLLIDRDNLLIRKALTEPSGIFTIEKDLKTDDLPINLKLRRRRNNKSFKFSKKPDHAYFDLDKVQYPLQIRKWKKGDRIVPFGMKGSKLVSDLMTDMKLSRFDKDNVWIMLSGKKIIWVIGLKVSNETRVTRKTKKILEIRQIPS